MAFVKKAAKVGPGRPMATGWNDEEFKRSHPAITEHLVLEEYEGGSKRVPSSLSVFFQDGCLKVSLNDKDNEQSLFVTASSLTEALDSLEAALQSTDPPWRQWKGFQGQKKKGKKT